MANRQQVGDIPIGELHSIHERQCQQMMNQQELIADREKRLAQLKAGLAIPGGSGGFYHPAAHQHHPREISLDEEITLQKLRGLRGQTEKYRIHNESLAREVHLLRQRHEKDSVELARVTQRLNLLHQQIRIAERWQAWVDMTLKQTEKHTTDFGVLCSASKRRPDRSSSTAIPQPQFVSQDHQRFWLELLSQTEAQDKLFASWAGPLAGSPRHNGLVQRSPPPISLPKPPPHSDEYKKKQAAAAAAAAAAGIAAPPPRTSSINNSHNNALRGSASSSNSSAGSLMQHNNNNLRVNGAAGLTAAGAGSGGFDNTSPRTYASSLTKAAANSPPSARRASLMLLLNSGASTINNHQQQQLKQHNHYNHQYIHQPPLLPAMLPPVNAPPATTAPVMERKSSTPSSVMPSALKGTLYKQKSTEASIIALGRAKTPPRYASRTMINETYMRGQLSKANLEKYKKTAIEIYHSELAKLSADTPLILPKLSASLKPQLSPVQSLQPALTLDQTPLKIIDINIKPVDADDDDNESSASTSSSLELNGLITTSNQHPRDVIEVSLPATAPKISSTAAIRLEPTVPASAPPILVKNTTLTPPASSKSSTATPAPSHEVPSATDVNRNTIPSKPDATAIAPPPDKSLSDDHTATVPVPPKMDTKDPSPAKSAKSSPNSAEDEQPVQDIYVPPIDPNVRPILRASKTIKVKDEVDVDTKKSPAWDEAPETVPLAPLITAVIGRNSVRFHPLALLLDAALEGDINLVKQVASEVEDVSEPNDEGITALHNAVCAGRMEIAEFLVRDKSADVNAGDTDGWTPLHCAASCANLNLARLLVEHGAALFARTLSDQETPLEKCDHVVDDDVDCEQYLNAEHEKLGSVNDSLVYAVFDRCVVLPGEAPLRSDELEFRANDQLRVINRSPESEAEWMLAEHLASGKTGLVPKAFLSTYPLLKVPKQWHERINWSQLTQGMVMAMQNLEIPVNNPDQDETEEEAIVLEEEDSSSGIKSPDSSPLSINGKAAQEVALTNTLTPVSPI